MLRDVAGNPNYVRPQQERISLEESSPVKAALDWMQVLSDMASAAPNDQQDPGIFRIRIKCLFFLHKSRQTSQSVRIVYAKFVICVI